jgi:ABC-2 type transport system permease protein
VFSWVIPVILVANVPARILTRSQESPWQALGQMLLATLLVLSLTRMLWQRGLKRYSSASS